MLTPDRDIRGHGFELKDKAFFATDKNLMDTDEYNTMIESVDCIVINRQYSPHFMPLQDRSIIISCTDRCMEFDGGYVALPACALYEADRSHILSKEYPIRTYPWLKKRS
ncbi:MAG: hypothetical protein A3K22_00515 [Deltaproteobacteria bacterium RBG_16_42_7]|nr:MAG: hypothetical protein A3K22_00515 [Deltaproteobacteria bacterium RBG_16_42_7]